MRLKALIFDVDGTLADTEREAHLPASNEAFARLGFPIHWSWAEFMSLIPIPGNHLRMRQALEKLSPPLPPAQLEAALTDLVRLKQQLYVEKYLSQVRLRPGVRNLVAQAVQRQIRLAIVSISAESQIEALLRRHLPEFAAHFNPILGKQAGPKTAPDSPLYRRCLAELGVTPAETLVIEDSASGWQAARAVGLSGAVIYNEYTFGQNFAGATLVARSLEFFDLDRLVELCLPV